MQEEFYVVFAYLLLNKTDSFELIMKSYKISVQTHWHGIVSFNEIKTVMDSHFCVATGFSSIKCISKLTRRNISSGSGTVLNTAVRTIPPACSIWYTDQT